MFIDLNTVGFNLIIFVPNKFIIHYLYKFSTPN